MKCQFHPTKVAENHCDHCRKDFCGQCSDQSISGRSRDLAATCFICGGGLEPLASGSQIVPFWSRIGEIYKYPLSLQAIITIVIISGLSTMLQGFGLLALIPVIAISLYSFACLRSTAAGEKQAPDVEASFQGSVAPVFYAGISMAIAIFAAGFAFYKLGYGMGFLISFFLMVVMPAAIIIIAVEEKLFPALNPANLIGIIKATGASYFVMVLFNIVMLSSMGVLSSMIVGTQFTSFSFFLTSLIGNYYGIVMYHIMGYLVYQNHVELGYRVSGKAGVMQVAERSDKQRQTAQLEILIKAGKFDAAREISRQGLKPGTPVWEWGRAFKLLCAANPSKDVDKYFERYVDKLESVGETEKIADAYLDLQLVKPSFELVDEKRKLDIAEALHHIGKDAQAVKLIQKLPSESNKDQIIERALILLVNSFKRLPGSEKYVLHFQALHKLHIAKTQH